MNTSTRWISQHQFESHQDHNTIQLDGDSEKGFSPKALLLSGLAACSGIDVVDILTKMKVPFDSLRIETEAEQTTEHPKVFKDISIVYHLHTAPENEDKVKKAIDLSLQKYCGVAAMLQKNSAISYKIVIE